MGSAKTLYLILNVIIFLLLVGMGLGIFFFATILFGVEQNIVYTEEVAANFKTEAKFYFFTILRLGVYVVFIVALMKWRKVIKRMLENDFYNQELIQSLFFSGKIMVIAAISSWCIDWIGNLFFRLKFIVGLTEKSLVYLLIIAVGSFLMLISSVLKESQAIKEENDLTI
ncbi:MAG: hypothetical protein HRU49_11280 [Winogradskyella sp.]|uniref:hypothetical protein n=1 Tax=Winogradskyella sp. TaxID=1883156 RepID=UPI0025F40408|nr:hypothetical protein [Winogradskyella sp.]NRB84339.1 hypothetical protein [Winogradskyella sp.]